jgi:hypothetical protein
MDKFTLHINQFADRVRAMNQMRNKELRITDVEANNLLADITQMSMLVARMAENQSQDASKTVELTLDGGGFQ